MFWTGHQLHEQCPYCVGVCIYTYIHIYTACSQAWTDVRCFVLCIKAAPWFVSEKLSRSVKNAVLFCLAETYQVCLGNASSRSEVCCLSPMHLYFNVSPPTHLYLKVSPCLSSKSDSVHAVSYACGMLCGHALSQSAAYAAAKARCCTTL